MKRYIRITQILCLGFAVHLCACIAVNKVRSEDPSKSLNITSSSKAIILYGKNSWGYTSVKLFDQWSDLAKYMSKNNLTLPPIAAAYIPQNFEIELKALNPEESITGFGRSQKHKVLWRNNHGPSKIIITPDIATAQVFKEYAHYVGMKSGSLGFSLPLQKIEAN